MLLESGQWLGRGSLVTETSSRGVPVTAEVTVERDEEGATLTGQWRLDDGEPQHFAARIAANESGTYTLSLRLAGERLQGTAKLDSPPNLCLLWNDGATLNATVTVFAASRGYGCRGFLRDSGSSGGGGGIYTWEMAFSPQQASARGDNVVSLHRRRR
jgi:hypothetical protein